MRLISFVMAELSSGICIIKHSIRFSHDSDNYHDLSLCYPSQPSASADNTNFGLVNYRYHAQPHPIIVNYYIDLSDIKRAVIG